MRIRNVTLSDFGLYRGRQTLDLLPRKHRGSNRPVVLVGGHNGAGKTTILEALRLCLYGRLALGSKVHDSEYRRYLHGMVHRSRNALLHGVQSSVGVEFDYAREGKQRTYLVERSWVAKAADDVEETFQVFQDGEPLAEVDPEHWSDFVRTLIPPGLSQLFFFDGEKIQRLAEAETESEELAESVKALLGLDVVERLQLDLDVLVARRVKDKKGGGTAKRLAELDARVHAIATKLTALSQEEAQLRTRRDYLAGQVEAAEGKLSQSGQGIANRHSALETKRNQLAAKLEELRNALREVAEGPFAFALCPDLSRAVLAQIEEEARHEERDVLRRHARQLAKRMVGRLTSASAGKRFGLSIAVRRALETEIGKLVSEYADEGGPGVEVHGLSEQHRKRLTVLLDDAARDAAGKMAALSAEVVAVEKSLQLAQKRLNAVPDNADLEPTVKKLSGLQAKHAEANVALEQRIAERTQLKAEQETVERERRRILEKESEAAEVQGRIALAGRARAALDDYLTRLTAAKVQQLEQEVIACFNQLCRKEDLVRSVRIDARTFQTQLADARGRIVAKSELSAGEKQLYAVALLWGLARVSGRPLPMIIDTPLGRLDSIHRRNLIERYFPVASHQVVILSTDTEVDQTCARALRPATSHALRLVHHEDEGWTQATSGYFWNEEDTHAAASA